uniref:C2 domain-containing protein n=1 Tax=Mucochytrium quahogii TaxID=96639 RepID=A0A7S2S3Y9_9STRA|mmetsp:Transcript_8878/g.16643  ORF Transcript_8878/g.16643 Transcript_8878/m.16643 type:complete len:1527 (-) Transcript_8878:4868-9448(-)
MGCTQSSGQAKATKSDKNNDSFVEVVKAPTEEEQEQEAFDLSDEEGEPGDKEKAMTKKSTVEQVLSSNRARYEIYISHVKGRGDVFKQPNVEFFVEFYWGGEKRNTSMTKAASSAKGCVWDSVIHYDYKHGKGLKYSDSMQSLRDNVLALDEKKKMPQDDMKAEDLLVVEVYAVKRHMIRDDEEWMVGDFKIALSAVLSGPLHHVFALKMNKDVYSQGEACRLSYNCRITQFANWKLRLSKMAITYNNPNPTKRESEPVSAKAEFLGIDTIREESERRPIGLTDSLLRVASDDIIKDFVEDKTKRFVLRYKLNKPDMEQPVLFESRTSVYPKVDNLGVKYTANWSGNNLPTIEEPNESRFRSFLTCMIGFQVFQILWEEPQPQTSRRGPGHLVAQKSIDQQRIRLKAVDSFVLDNDEGKMLGECWVPVEQLFEMAHQNLYESQDTHGEETSEETDAINEKCQCFDALNADPNSVQREHPATVIVRKELRLFGKRVGMLNCKICFEILPGTMQLGHGVLTEEGVSLMSPMILQGTEERPSMMRKLMGGGGVADSAIISPALKRLRGAVQMLEKSLRSSGQPGKNSSQSRDRMEASALHADHLRACTALLAVLCTSEKESMVSFVYRSTMEMVRMQQTLLELWELIMGWLDAVSFTIRIRMFEVLIAILKRGELGEFMIPDMMSPTITMEDKKLALQYRGLCYRLLRWVLQKLSLKGSFIELRLFCARVVAIMCFRLPKFGRVVYRAILPENETSIKEWAQSKELEKVLSEDGEHYEHPEWSCGYYSLDNVNKIPETPAKANGKLRSASTASSTGRSDSVASGSMNRASSVDNGSNSGSFDPLKRVSTRIGNDDNERLLNWDPFHKALGTFFSVEELEVQESSLPMGEVKDGVYIAPMWLRRIQKHGHFFFLVAQEWIIYVLDTLGPLATSSTENFEGRTFQSGIKWFRIAGYTHILKAFLLELRRRDIQDLPDSLRKLSMLLLVDESLITAFVNIVIPKTNIFDIDNVTASIDLLSAWVTTLHGWPGRFVVSKVFRSKGPFIASEANNVLDTERSHFFTTMYNENKDKLEQGKEVVLKDVQVIPEHEVAQNIDIDAPTQVLAQMRASGTLIQRNGQQQVKSVNGGYDSTEPFVTAWDFDPVCIYFPHLDIVRKNFKRANQHMGLMSAGLGIKKNNDRSKCNWFSQIYADSPPVLPTTFEFKLLSHALWVLLHVDHFQVVLKALEFIYNHWDAFPGSFQNRIRSMMLSTKSDPFTVQAGEVSALKSEQTGFGNILKQGYGSAGTECTPLFLLLFFHWQDEVRVFFDTLVAFKLCRRTTTQNSPAFEGVLAATRLALVCADEDVWDGDWLWNTNDPVLSKSEKFNAQRLQEQYVLGKTITKQFEDHNAALRRSGGSVGARFSPAKKQLEEEFGKLESVSSVDDMVRAAKSEEAMSASETSSSSQLCEKQRAIRKDLRLMGLNFWPKHLQPYAIPAVTKFRKLWVSSLDTSTPAPHLEWNVVVLDQGEMRSVGGLAHFRPERGNNKTADL